MTKLERRDRRRAYQIAAKIDSIYWVGGVDKFDKSRDLIAAALKARARGRRPQSQADRVRLRPPRTAGKPSGVQRVPIDAKQPGFLSRLPAR